MRMPRLIPCVLLLGAAALASAAERTLSAADQVRKCRRGVKSLVTTRWAGRQPGPFPAAHFQIIHDGGFGAVRIVLMAFRFMSTNNELPASWFATLDGLVNGRCGKTSP